MISWDSYRVGVDIYAEQLPIALIRYHIREAARDFCQKTLILRETLTAQSIIQGVRDYTLTASTDTAIVKAIEVEVQETNNEDRQRIEPFPEEALDRDKAGWRVQGTTDRYFYQRVPEVLSLSWTPEATFTNGLFVVVALKPSAAATQGHDYLYNHWHEAIEAGALARILSVPGQPWTNLNMAAGFAAAYGASVSMATVDAVGSHTNKPTFRQRFVGYGI